MKYYLIFIVALSMFIASCSEGARNATAPSLESPEDNFTGNAVGVTDYFPDGSAAAGMGLLGLFTLDINQSDMSAEMSSLRKTSLPDVLEVVDITNFLQLAPCTDCAKIKSVALNDDGNVVVSIGIKHPFAPGDPYKPITGRNRADLHVFNVEGVVISDSAGLSFQSINQRISGLKLLNSDGYTGYLDYAIDEIFPTSATVHPYITHFDDYSSGNFDAGNPMGFASVTDPPPSGNLVMAMGCDYDFKDYIFDLNDTQYANLMFAVGCTYAVSAATKSLRFSPEYRIPQHNKKAASEVRTQIITNNLKGGDILSTAQMEIHVVDINHNVPIGDSINQMRADSSVKQIIVCLPSVLTSNLLINGGNYISGSGHDPSDPLVYSLTITNTGGADEGSYFGLIKVIDSYNPGLNTATLLNGMDGIERVDPLLNPLTGLFAISEFATYQTFKIDVLVGGEITVICPNGGEQWSVGSDEEIVWTSENVTGTVFIEYSKDNFISDIHSIAIDVSNTGSYLWEDIPNDPSNTVRVRVSSTINPDVNDISDANFSIVGDSIWWRSHMYNLSNIGWNPTANMPNPSSLQLQWQTPNVAFKFTTPVIADGKVFLSTNSTYWERPDMTFYCYNLATGAELWKKPINQTSVSTGWRVFSCPVWWQGDDGIDRIAVGGDKVYCFNADTGEQLWTYDTTYLGNDVGWWSNQMQEYDGMVLARSRYNPLVVLDFKTGDLISTVICSSMSEGGCTAKDGKVYINSATYVDCAEISTGTLLWSTLLPSSAGNMNHWVNPTLVGDRIYVTSTTSHVISISIANIGGYMPGQVIWDWYDTSMSGTSMMAGASARQDGGVTRLYVPSSGASTYVYCLEDQGSSASLIWRSGQTGSYEGAAVWSNAPSYSAGVIYCPSASTNMLYAFDASNGSLIWSYSAGSTAKCGVSIVDNRLVLMTNGDVRMLKVP